MSLGSDYTPIFKKKFNKDLKLAIKRGKQINKLKKIIEELTSGNSLDRRYLDHPLKGAYADCPSVTLSRIGF